MAEPVFDFQLMDCAQGMRQMAAGSVDVIVTSPPYNLGINYSKYNDSREWPEYLRWTIAWATEAKRVLKQGGSFFLNVGASPSNPLLPHQLAVELSRLFVLQNTFHWIKSITVRTKAGASVSAGHFKPIRSKRFVNDLHEYVYHFTHEGDVGLDRLAIGVAYSDKSNIARWGHTKGRDLRCRGNTWFIPYETIVNRDKERPHPATFPVELAANCIRVHGCRPDLVVLDPFVGIGHAAMAAQQCAVGRFIGFDIDPAYLEVACSVVRGNLPRPSGKRPAARRASAPQEARQASLFDQIRLGR